MSCDILLFDWPYTFSNPRKGPIILSDVKRDYALIVKMNKFCLKMTGKNDALFEEIFLSDLQYKEMKIIKDFHIKDISYIKALRKYHKKITSSNRI